jgi:TetR/AcrR family transcriptional regulator, transcriptional repressor of bet genes
VSNRTAVSPRRVGRPSNTEERRRQIVEAFGRVLASAGYEKATIAAIAKEAGLAPGLVHYHFDDKREVLVALVASLVETIDSRSRARLEAAGDDPWARLDALIDAHLALGPGADEAAVRAWAALGAEALREPGVREQYAEALRSSLSLFEELVVGCLGKRKANAEVKELAAAILSAIEGALRLGTVAPGLLPRGFAAPMVRKLARGLIEAKR